jgi:CrcB protein
MFFNIMFVGLGGFVGATFRYLVNNVVTKMLSSLSFPVGTITVNVLGSFLFGFLFQILSARVQTLPANLQLFLFTGVLGAFTTFSTFSNDTFDLFNSGNSTGAIINIILHFTLCILAIFLGHIIGGFLK